MSETPRAPGIAARKGFIDHLHAFRGFAIICIVAEHAHSAQTGRYLDTSPGAKILNSVGHILFHDSTLYFTLISGLLFSLVLQQRGWPAFFTSKLKNVVSPYIVMTLIFTWYGLNDQFLLAGPFSGTFSEYLAAVAANLFSGGAIYQLWYIPILFLLYLSTPLVSWIVATNSMRWLVWLLMLLPLVLSRTWPDFSYGTVAYFLGAYVAGVLLGKHYRVGLELFSRLKVPLIAVVIVTSAALLAAYLYDIDAIGFVSLLETLFYLQKMSAAALVILWFSTIENKLPRFLHTFGTYAFSIYFLHAILLVFFVETQLALQPEFISVWVLLPAAIVSVVFAMSLSVLISILVKRVFGRRSRMLVGA